MLSLFYLLDVMYDYRDHIKVFASSIYILYVELLFLDNVCIESMSVKMTKKTLERCTLNINSLTDKVRK